MRQGHKRGRGYGRRGRFGLFYKVLSVLLIALSIFAGCIIFFHTDKILVSGNLHYGDETIVEASRVRLGSNLFLINKPQISLNILAALPFVESVSPVRHLPDTLEIRIRETKAVASLATGDGFWLINSDGKLLEFNHEKPVDYPEILSLAILNPKEGTRFEVDTIDFAKAEALKNLLKAMEENRLVGNMTEFIDFSVSGNIYFGYDNVLTVVMPLDDDFNRLSFSLGRVAETFKAKEETLEGTLDLTYGYDQARLLLNRKMPDNM